MYETRKGTVSINYVPVPVYYRDAGPGRADLEVLAGTTGPSYCRDRSGGGRVCFSLERMKGDFCFFPLQDEQGEIKGFELAGCGDDAMNALIQALSFALDTLNRQCVRNPE